jgi:hypothetical protein
MKSPVLDHYLVMTEAYNPRMAKRTPKKGIIGTGRVSIRPGKNSNRIIFSVRLAEAEERRLYKMLQKRYPKK